MSEGSAVFDSPPVVAGCVFDAAGGYSPPAEAVCTTGRHCGLDIAPSATDTSWAVKSILNGTLRPDPSTYHIAVELPAMIVQVPGTPLSIAFNNVVIQYNHVDWSGTWIAAAGTEIGTIVEIGQDPNMGNIRHLDIVIVDREAPGAGNPFTKYRYVNPTPIVR